MVIAIIAILASMLLPAIAQAKTRARALICRSNLRQWAIILNIYTDSNQNRLPTQGNPAPPLSIGMDFPWLYSMRDYGSGTEGIRFCPSATKLANPVRDTTKPGPMPSLPNLRGGTFKAWGSVRFTLPNKTTVDYYGSYGMNSWLAVPPTKGLIVGVTASAWSPEQRTAAFWRTTDFGGPNLVPAFLDSWWWCAWVKETDRPPLYEGQTNAFPCACWDSIQRFCINRHNKSVNAAFVDGSARRVGLKELWTLKWHRSFNTAGPWTRAGGARANKWPAWMRQLPEY